MCELRFATLAASKRVGAVNAPARFFWQWQMHVSAFFKVVVASDL